MNIESETKSVLRTDFTISEKVRLIKRFTNFREEDIFNAIKEKYGFYVNEIYIRLLQLDNLFPRTKRLTNNLKKM